MKRELVDVEGVTLSLSNLDKVLYPAVGFTKGDVIAYLRGDRADHASSSGRSAGYVRPKP